MSGVDCVAGVSFNCEIIRLVIKNLSGGPSSKSSWLQFCCCFIGIEEKMASGNVTSNEKVGGDTICEFMKLEIELRPQFAGTVGAAPLKTKQFHLLAGPSHSEYCLVADMICSGWLSLCSYNVIM